MDPARRTQLDHLDAARHELLSWAAANKAPLVHVEFTTPFETGDYRAAVWLFLDTDANVARCAADGTTARLEREFRAILARRGYPSDWLAGISFCVDSHENVERNYKGSYFYRLR